MNEINFKTILFLLFVFSFSFLNSVEAQIIISGTDSILQLEFKIPQRDNLDSSESENQFNFAFVNQTDSYSHFNFESLSKDPLDSLDSRIKINYIFVSQADSYLHFDFENPYRPVALIKFFPKNPVKGVKVTFDASESFSPTGKILRFQWQIRNISTSEVLFTFIGATTNFTFNETGEYEITLVVTDSDGATSSTSTILRVEPFSFAIITDLHIGRGYPDYGTETFKDEIDNGDYYLTERLKNVVQWVIDNRNDIQCENTTCPIKFLAVLGDIADSAEKSEFLKAKKILDPLNDYGIPYVPVFGNHDVWPYTDFEEATSTFGEDYFDEIFWSENATNTKLMKEILGIQRDESNKKYKNFAFDYGGINFIGLDFIKREKTGKAEIHTPTELWLKQTLNKFQGEEPVILFSHHPLAKLLSRDLYVTAIWNFNIFEIEKIKKIIEEYESLTEGTQILGSFAGHIHGYYPQEILGVNIPEVNRFFEANWQYPSLSTVPILTTEALMVASNRSDEYLKGLKKKDEGMKGIIRVVKVLNENEIDYKTIEGKYDPETKQGKEFIGLNPYISRAYTIVPEEIYPCLFFKAHAFTERDVEFYWDFGDGTTSSQAWIPTKCYKESKTYNVVLKVTDKNNLQFSESITRKIEIKEEPLVPKSIKLTKETWEKAKVISKEFAEDLKEIIKKAGNIALDFTDELLFKLKITHSEEIEVPIGSITTHFERAKEDIDLTNLKMDSNYHTKKVLFYMPEWPKEIEREKVLFVPY